MDEREYYFKDNKHHVIGGIIPPHIIKLSGKTSIVPWWVEVPDNTTLEDIVWVRKEKTTNTKPGYFEIKSSSGKETYRVTKTPNNKYHCTCPGYWRSKDHICKHIKQVINEN
jgi:hypothetical protein